MEHVTIWHPVTGGTAEVARSALATHMRGGWEEVPPEPPASKPSPAAEGDGSATADDSTSRSRLAATDTTTQTGE